MLVLDVRIVRCTVPAVELALDTNLREVESFTIIEKAPNRASCLRVHYSKQSGWLA